jgi:hypothetical protein
VSKQKDPLHEWDEYTEQINTAIGLFLVCVIIGAVVAVLLEVFA